MTSVVSSCAKQVYRTPKQAIRVARKCQRRRTVRLRTYFCRVCHGFHLTSC